MKPKLFIGSSVEGLSVAYAIQQNLNHIVEATVWDQGVFTISETTINSLEQALEASDFGVFVFSPDDVTLMRDSENKTVRDNVLFEFGLFTGKLGRKRVFFVTPNGSDTYIPSDLLGVTAGKYDPNREDGSLQAATGAACNEIRQAIKKLGFLNPFKNENESSDDNVLHNKNNQEWIIDLIDNKFESARAKLTELKNGTSGEQLLKHELWLCYIDFKENDYKGLQPLIDKIKNITGNINIQALGLSMLSWENYDEVALNIINNHFSDYSQEPSILIVKSACLSSIGDEAGAISALLPYINNPEISIKLSELYQSSGNDGEALQVIANSYRDYPSNKDVVYRYSRLLLDSNANKEAVFLLNYLTNEDPDNPEYWGYLSNACLKLDLYDRAMSTCRKAVAVSKDKSSWVMHNIGNMLNNKGFYTDAIEWLEKGIALDGSSEYAHSRLASSIKNQSDEFEQFQQVCKEGRMLIRKSYMQEQ